MQREKEVYRQLDKVYDPELDQPLTELGFIEGVNVDEGSVIVSFRLPTYWCSPNFAFIMAEDIRDRVSELPWVTNVKVHLIDHLMAEEINHGVAQGCSFSETFPDLAEGGLEEIRKTFRDKAFLVRQERLLRHLINLGLCKETIPMLTIGQLMEGLDDEGKLLAQRYLDIRKEAGFGSEPDELAFIRPDGGKIDPEELSDYLLTARRTRLNMEFNTHQCRSLLLARKRNEEGIIT